MKIRIKGNSVRLRLAQSEVNQFGEIGEVIEKTNFPNGQSFSYILKMHNKETLSANFENQEITVLLPKDKALEWVNSEIVGIEKLLELEGNKSLKILVEKDFNCLIKREGEDDADAFPNPLS